MTSPGEPSIPGLQRERTALAWDRTGIAFILVGLLFLRGTGGLSLAWKLGGISTVVFGSLLMLHGYRRYVRTGAAPLAATGLLRVVGLATVLLSLAAAALIVVGHGS